MFLAPKIAMPSQNSPFYNKIMWFWLVIHMLIRLWSKKCHFLPFFGDFCLFSLGKGSEIFFEGRKFFSRKFASKRFQIYLFEIPNSFWLIMCYFLVMLKKSFFPIFRYKLGFSEIHNLKKYSGPGFSLLGTSQTIKYRP